MARKQKGRFRVTEIHVKISYTYTDDETVASEAVGRCVQFCEGLASEMERDRDWNKRAGGEE